MEGLATTRAIRRYKNEPIADAHLRDILFSATRAPSGSNRQPFRFVVLTDGEKAAQAKALIARSAQEIWRQKERDDGYAEGSGSNPDFKISYGPHHARIRRSFCRRTGADFALLDSLSSARPHGGCICIPRGAKPVVGCPGPRLWRRHHRLSPAVEAELKALLAIPEDVFVACTLTLGKPQGGHGPVRRRPLDEFVFTDSWGKSAHWAVDPPGTRFTSAGPPQRKKHNSED